MKQINLGLNKSIIEWFDKSFYPDFAQHWDDQLLCNLIKKNMKPEMTILDLGAGSGIIPYLNFRGLAAKVCGVDPDRAVLRNVFLDEARIGTGESIPYADNSFDMVFACNVLEHLKSPKLVFCEVKRVLKKRGVFIVKTPNIYHYVALLARLTPQWFHAFYAKMMGRKDEDTFSTFYRANSQHSIVKLASETGFKVENIEQIEGRPEYLRLFFVSYIFGILYERIVNALRWMNKFRLVIYVVLEKG